MRVVVVGAGNVGSTLARRWHDAGREVVVGVRGPQDAKYAALRDAGLDVTSVPDAARASDVITSRPAFSVRRYSMTSSWCR